MRYAQATRRIDRCRADRRVGKRVPVLLVASLLVTGALVQLGFGAQPALAAPVPSGGQIAYGEGSSLWSAGIYGEGRVELVRDLDPMGGGGPRWSHDGTKIAYIKRGDIWMVNADGTGDRQMTVLSWRVSLGLPHWSADDKRIFYDGRAAYVTVDSGEYGSFPMPVYGTELDFSPDGTRVAFSAEVPGKAGYGISVMNVDGTGLTRLTDGGAASDGRVRWSPDGRLLSFTRGATGTDVFVMAADGTGLKRVRENAFSFGWAPDSAHLLVVGGGYAFTQVVALDGTSRTRLGGCDPVLNGADWRPTPTSGVGAARSWGWNAYGQLGNGATVDRSTPATVPGLSGVVQEAGGLLHSLALRDDGTVWAWGWNGVGQLGDGTTTDRRTPTKVAGLTEVVCVSASAYNSMAVRQDGTVWAWGWNGWGAVGDGTNIDRHTPVQVKSLVDIETIGVGVFHAVAQRADGTVWAWGWNGYGQLGDGTTTARAVPVQVTGFGVAPIPPSLGGLPRLVKQVSAGAYHTAAVTGDGYLFTWGWNGLGQLGDGTTGDRYTPRMITGFIRSAFAAGYHTVALRQDGTMRASGYNGFGQLGDGTTVDRNTPVTVGTVDPVVSVAAGWFHTLAMSNTGVSAWGWNNAGQLGDGTTLDRLTPVPVPLLGGARSISAGGAHSLGA